MQLQLQVHTHLPSELVVHSLELLSLSDIFISFVLVTLGRRRKLAMDAIIFWHHIACLIFATFFELLCQLLAGALHAGFGGGQGDAEAFGVIDLAYALEACGV